MNRWTNSFPWFVHNLKFTNKEENHIQEYMQSWLMMKEDFEKNGPGPFEHNMTKVYFPHDVIAPIEYGLVLIDMQKNKIFNMNNYSTPGSSFLCSDGIALKNSYF